MSIIGKFRIRDTRADYAIMARWATELAQQWLRERGENKNIRDEFADGFRRMLNEMANQTPFSPHHESDDEDLVPVSRKLDPFSDRRPVWDIIATQIEVVRPNTFANAKEKAEWLISQLFVCSWLFAYREIERKFLEGAKGCNGVFEFAHPGIVPPHEITVINSFVTDAEQVRSVVSGIADALVDKLVAYVKGLNLGE